jgi:3-oxoacyl-[acyl-carrier-protein] synthase-3
MAPLPYRNGAYLVPANIAATGSYLPKRILTNHDLEKMVSTSDEWIITRTGIRERRIAQPDELTSTMGARAAEQALQTAQLDPREVDLIVVATCTPDTAFPSTACYIQHSIGANRAAAFDISAACSGFIYALVTARQFISSGLYKNILVIGAEKMSSITNWEDRNTCVLFGDGAGAVLLQGNASHHPDGNGNGSNGASNGSHRGAGLLSFDMGADGAQTGILSVPAGGCRIPITDKALAEKLHCIQMSGREVYRQAVGAMYQSASRCLASAECTPDEVTWVIPHQANLRIIEAIAERLKIPMSKFITNVDRCGNTSAACMPIALDEAVRAGRIKAGDKLLFVAFGGGLTWASLFVEW